MSQHNPKGFGPMKYPPQAIYAIRNIITMWVEDSLINLHESSSEETQHSLVSAYVDLRNFFTLDMLQDNEKGMDEYMDMLCNHTPVFGVKE